jgi:RNA polymerase sigma-70 factor (ECF subfamily)
MGLEVTGGARQAMSSEQLFRAHAAFVARFLLQLGVRSADLDDVVQEVFLVVHARGGYTPGPAKVTSYLGSIAVHAAQSYRRKQARQRQREAGASLDELPTALPSVHQALEANEESARIRAALATLPEELRAVLVLVELENESCGSVAAAMGCSVGTIYWRAHTARKRFAKALAQATEAAGETLIPAGKRFSP